MYNYVFISNYLWKGPHNLLMRHQSKLTATQYCIPRSGLIVNDSVLAFCAFMRFRPTLWTYVYKPTLILRPVASSLIPCVACPAGGIPHRSACTAKWSYCCLPYPSILCALVHHTLSVISFRECCEARILCHLLYRHNVIHMGRVTKVVISRSHADEVDVLKEGTVVCHCQTLNV